MRFRDLNLKSKQLIAFGLVLVVLSAASGFIIHRMTSLKESFEEVATNWLPRSVAIAELSRGISNYRTLALQHALTSNLAAKSSIEKLIGLQIDQIEDYLDRYESLRDQSRERELISTAEDSLFLAFDSDWDEYQSVFQEWFQLSQQDEYDSAKTLIVIEGAMLHENIRLHLEELVDHINEESLRAALRAEQLHHSTRQIFAVLFVVSVLLSALIALSMTRLISGPLQQLADATEYVSQGNLDLHLDVSGKDEIGGLAKSFDRMAVSLQKARAKTERQAERLRQQNTELEATLRRLKETQEELLLKEKMASLGKLVAGLAHEINNPIGTVIGAADVSKRALQKLEQRLGSGLSETELHRDQQLNRALSALNDNANITMIASQRIAEIIQSLKSFSRLDEAEYQIADLHEGLESSLVLLGKKELSHVNVVRQFGEVPPIGCYPGLLNQVFISLLGNAAHAIVESGTISIRTYCEKVDVVVEISDTGIGIAPERMKRLFDFTFSADSTRVKMGTGLLTAYMIVQKHGGQIEVTSDIGKGSTFSVRLPITAEQNGQT
jgi:signal transduction histidine kinase